MAMLAASERARSLIWHNRAIFANQNVSRAKGDWRTARDFIEQGLATSLQDPALLGARALLEHQLGEADAGEAYLVRLLDTIPGDWSNPPGEVTRINFHRYLVPAVVIPVAAYITGGMAKFEVVEGLAQSIFASPHVTPDIGYEARIGLALLAVQRRDPTAAGELYGALQPILGTMSRQGLAVDRILGLLAQTMGNLDQATIHFGDAQAFCRKAGCRPELAWTCCDHADTLLQRNNPGDRERGMSLLDESLAISTELGMRPLIGRVQNRLEGSISVVAPVPIYPDGLTQREVEVLTLVAQGKSNREIGEELVISESTARRHVSNIYNKIGVNNRTEAARYALRMGLVSED